MMFCGWKLGKSMNVPRKYKRVNPFEYAACPEGDEKLSDRVAEQVHLRLEVIPQRRRDYGRPRTDAPFNSMFWAPVAHRKGRLAYRRNRPCHNA